MRDIGALLWVAIVAIGVISSVVSNARRQAARTPVPPRRFPQAPSQRPAAWAAPAAPQPPTVPLVTPRPAAPPPAAFAGTGVGVTPPPPPAPADIFPHPAELTRARRPRRFAGRTALRRAVVAAEVLGKPRALGDEYP